MRQVLVMWRLILHKRFVRGLICMRVRVKLLMEVARQHHRLLATLLAPPRRALRPPAPPRLSLVSHQEQKKKIKMIRTRNNATPVLRPLRLLSTPPEVAMATPHFSCRTSGWGFMNHSAVLMACRGCCVSQCQGQRRGRGGGDGECLSRSEPRLEAN